ncbi:MAG: LamG-like jellyroll fold domain-containing protein [Planctomycetota bacterium]
MTPLIRYTLAAFALAALMPRAEALDLVAGYNVGANDPLQLGTNFIVDQAATGGGDAFNVDGFFGWVAEYNDMWDIGTPVSISGVAVPIKAPRTENGDWTFTFFELDGGADPNGFDGYNFTDGIGETVLGSVTATFSGNGTTGTDEYFVDFDTPIDFTSASTGFAFHMQSTAAAELKVRPAGLVNQRGVRVGLADGTPVGGTNPNFRASIAGTPMAFDPPPPPSLEYRIDAAFNVPGNRQWESIEPSLEQFASPAPQPGDYNGDGLTNAVDYTVWRDNIGGDAATVFADGSRDSGNSGVVNSADEAFWQSQYGAPATVAVNDPSVPGITRAFTTGAVGQANVYENQIGGLQASRQDGSFEIWFKPDDLAGGDQVLFEIGGTGTGSYLSLQDNQLSFYINGQFDGNEQTVSTTLSDADWTQVAVVINNTFSPDLPSADDFIDLYVDGVLVASTSLSPTDINRWAGGNQAGLGIVGGNIAGGGPLLDGSGATSYAFDGEIAIFEYAQAAWDATEVLNRFNAITGASTQAVPEPGTVLVLSLGLLLAAGCRPRSRA